MRALIKSGKRIFVRVACEGNVDEFVIIARVDALRLLGKDKPRPRFNAYGDGDVVIG